MIAFSKPITLALGLVCLFAAASRASTITIPNSRMVTSTGYYTDTIGGGIGSPLLMTGGGANANLGGSKSDDGFSGPIALGFAFNFFGIEYTEVFANNNGSLTFGSGFDAWIPEALEDIKVPIIATYFADVDTTGPVSDVMYLRKEPNQIIVTWNQVGYYNHHDDKLNSFQLVLRGPDYPYAPQEGQVGLYYTTMQWETGDGSGDGGFGGVPATVGLGDGLGNSQIIEGSTTLGVSRVVADRHVWITEELQAPAPVPEPSTLLLVGAGAAILGRKLYSRKAKA